MLSLNDNMKVHSSSRRSSSDKLKLALKAVLFLTICSIPVTGWSQAAASWNYSTQTGTLGTTYNWIDCSSGTTIITGDDAQGSFLWPFTFSFYDNLYTTANSLSVATNGFIRLDGNASTGYDAASSYTLSSASTELGQIIATSVYDCNVGASSWVRYLVTGTSPNRILTIEYNNIEIDYNDGKYADVEVNFYETTNKVVISLGTDNITASGVDMGIQSGVSGYFNKWQEVASGTNNAWIEYIPSSVPTPPTGPAASWNYSTQTGTIGSTYSWIDCSAGSSIVSGDDNQAGVNWPFNFNFYDNSYTTSNSLSVCTNGFIRLDGVVNTDYSAASNYDLTATATSLGQIIAMAVYDGNVAGTGWVKSLVTGTAPNRIFTIEYNNLEIDYNDNKYVDVQVSFFESINKIVLKFGVDNINKNGVDMGIHSGVNTFFNKWQEVNGSTNNTWIEYTPPSIEVNATIGTSLASYPTLKTAFDKINDGTHKGNITIKIKNSTTEPVSAVLNASGTGSASYASVNIYPTKSGLSVSGDLAAPLIDLNGAENVVIDGRLDATGATKDLTINNISIFAIAGTSTIRFINDASNNTLKYCSFKGSETDASSGILFFSTTTFINGNDGNTISNNNITSSVTANRPSNAIYSAGTSGKENNGNIISNNYFYDFLNRSAASNGILLSSNTTAWTIDGNSFYETASFIPTASATYNVIQISNTFGNGFIVTNNYIGGNSALCGGAAWMKTNAANNIFTALNLNVGTTTASSVQNNTIKNFNWSNSSNATWTAISLLGGNVNIGTTTGNTIGAATGTGSVSVTGATNGQYVYGINITSTGTVDCRNNTIGSIIVNNGATLAGNFYGINKTATTGTTTISNNDIGSSTTANSINASSASTANAQVVYGIYNAGTGTIAISNNTISKLNNGTTNTSVGTLGMINGITSLNGTITISNNTIYDLSVANANTNASNSASVCGIAITGTANPKTVTGNTIYNLSNKSVSFAGNVIGMYYAGSTTGTNTLSTNFIHSLMVTGASSTAANIVAIKIETGVTTYYNNIINLGGNTKTTIYGIYETGAAGNNNNLYFNTVYISGSLASGSTNKSYALFSAASTNVRNFRNNIFMNARSTISGANLHYAAYFNYTASTNITLNYNDYFVSGTGGVLAYWNATNKTALPIITGQDANSLHIDPGFINAGGTSDEDYHTSALLSGVTGTGITTDFHGVTRGVIPNMGALEAHEFIWQGNTSTDFAASSNWQGGAVPPNGANISFAATPANDCYLDQNRTLQQITNTSAKKFVVNGKQFTLTGNIIAATANQIDATAASSVVIFAGAAAQSIPSGVFVSNTIDAFTLNNSSGLTQNGDLTLTTGFMLTSGAYTIGANTLSINGAVFITSGSLTGGSSSNIIVGGIGANTILPGVILNNLSLNRANGITTGGAVSVAGTLALTNGTLTLGAYTLTISGNSPTRTSGKIAAGNAGATLAFTNTTAITLPASIFVGNVNNLTINGTGGISAGNDFTVNGILNLQSANPTATKGSLAMGTFILTLGPNATTVGSGDVSGIVKRTSFTAGISYTFGNQYNTIVYQNTGTLPTEMSVKVTIGAAPSWKPDAIQRIFESIQTGASGAFATTSLNYLDSELNGNTEANLVIWSWQPGYPVAIEHGISSSNTTQNWLGSSNFPVDFLPSAFGTDFIAMANSQTILNTWNGSSSTDWNTSINWTKGYVPLSTDDVIIPNTSALLHEPTMPASTTINSLTIQLGGVVNGGAGTVFTVAGAAGAWTNNGTFNPGTSYVDFINPLATISGTTNFYNITLNSGAGLTLESGSIMRIAGTLTNNGTLHSTLNPNTIEYNGADQTVINPNGTIPGYNNLILSGSGTKTMPATAMNIFDEFILTGPVTATAQSSLTIGNELEILSGATFAAGAFDHFVGGHFDVGGHLDNAGTFTPTAGYAITLNGTGVQKIYGGSPITFENLIINNSTGIEMFTDVIVNDALTLTNGNLTVGTTTLTINGNVAKTGGFVNVSEFSSLTFGGTTAITIPGSLFPTAPSINNLLINRSGGVTFSTDFTVNGVLNLQSANPSSTKGSLDMWDGSTNKVLTMGASATTIGTGDVTGIITRNAMVHNVTYTFGNQFTSIIFPEVGTLPTSMSVKVSIGSAPGWKPGAVQRIYSAIQTGGSSTLALIKMHYLDSELNGNIEDNIVEWIYLLSGSVLLEQGRASFNQDDNWIAMANVDIANLTSDFSDLEIGISASELASLTWNGSVNTDWFETDNWTPTGAPSDNTVVIIPDAATTSNDPELPIISTCGTLELENGAILNASTDAQFTINGASGAWSSEDGTFNAGNSTVIFTDPDALIDGTTNFYNLTLNSGAAIVLSTGSVTRIAGALSNNGILRAAFLPNTIEYNGTDQTIINPNGLTPGYYNLILSGSGTKTMPSDGLSIIGDFSMAGSATTTAASDLAISGDFNLGTGTTFTTGSLDHLLRGNFTNNGNFIASVGDTIEFSGTGAQYIDGSSSTTFYILDLDEASGVTMATDITVDYLLEMDNGNLRVEDNTLGINGTITANGGDINLTTQSSLAFGGTTSITIIPGMFSGPPVINNLTINRSGGVTFSSDLTVNGVLNLQSVNPSSTKGSLDMIDGSLIMTLSMGASATTIGPGDVTGIVRRTAFIANIPYTFGNEFTTVTFDPGGTYPAELKFKISIGTSPSWKPTLIKRYLDIIQTGANFCFFTLAHHYLDSELNGNTETKLVAWSYDGSQVTEVGITDYDVTDNWVSMDHVPSIIFPTSFGVTESTIGTTEQNIITWNGSISALWTTDNNWTPAGTPDLTSDVVIPDAGITDHDPALPASAEVKSLTLNAGAVLNAGINSQFTLNGAFRVWKNLEGTFNAGNSNVIFTNPDASISGTTNFYDLTINGGALLTMGIVSITSISGSLINNGIMDAEYYPNSFEYKGTDQTIINPNADITGYQDLILSGSGTKTLPGTALNIHGDFSITGTASVTASQDLTIEGSVTIGASSNFTTGSFAHYIGGNLENNGSFTAAGSTITLNGKSAQTIGGTTPVDFNNLTIGSGSITTVNTAGQTISGILLSNGTLNSGGNITLLSTAAQTALIDGTGTGQVLGNVIMQRYLPSGFGYKYFSSPFQTAPVSELGDDMDLSASFPPVYRYDESRISSGWVKYIIPGNPLVPLAGYSMNFGSVSDPKTVDVTGVVNNGSMSVTLYNHNNTYTKGYNFVGNPFSSPIDWDAATGWIKTNIDDAVYYFKGSTTDQYGGTYSTYLAGHSSDGLATNIIPSMQGFFVHVSDGTFPVTATFGLSNDVRITNLTHPFLKSSQQNQTSLLRLIAFYSDDSASYDPAVIYFDDKATFNFDGQLDALKLYNTDNKVPNFYTSGNDGSRLSINALPFTADNLYRIPLGLLTARDGNIAFKIKDIGSSFAGKSITISDIVTGINQNLSDNNEYKVFLDAGNYPDRFFLNLSDVATDVTVVDSKADWFTVYSSHGKLKAEISLLSGETGTLSVYNLTGQILFNDKVYVSGYHEYSPGVKDGIYIVRFISDMRSISKKLFIHR